MKATPSPLRGPPRTSSAPDGRGRRRMAAFVLLSLIGVQHLPAAETDPRSEGRALLEKGDYKNAATNLKKALASSKAERGRSDAATLEIMGELAAAYQGMGKRRRADRTVARMRKARLPTEEQHTCVAWALERLGRLSAAIEEARGAVSVAPTHESYKLLAELLTRAQNYKEAVTWWEAALSVGPPDYQIMTNLGRCREFLGQRKEARALYEQAKALCPDCYRIYVELGYAALKDGPEAFEEAEALFKEAVERYPENGDAHHHLGWLYKERGDYQKADESYRRAIQLAERESPPDMRKVIHAMTNLSTMYKSQGRADDLAVLYGRCLSIAKRFPDTPAYWRAAGFLAVAVGDVRNAEIHYRRALDLTEHVVDLASLSMTLNGLAEICANSDRLEEAEGYYARAFSVMESRPGRAEYANTALNYAALLRTRGNQEGAELILKKTAATLESGTQGNGPLAIDVLRSLADLYRAAGRASDEEDVNKRIDGLKAPGKSPR